jgi:hypothetical protein
MKKILAIYHSTKKIKCITILWWVLVLFFVHLINRLASTFSCTLYRAFTPIHCQAQRINYLPTTNGIWWKNRDHWCSFFDLVPTITPNVKHTPWPKILDQVAWTFNIEILWSPRQICLNLVAYSFHASFEIAWKFLFPKKFLVEGSLLTNY